MVFLFGAMHEKKWIKQQKCVSEVLEPCEQPEVFGIDCTNLYWMDGLVLGMTSNCNQW